MTIRRCVSRFAVIAATFLALWPILGSAAILDDIGEEVQVGKNAAGEQCRLRLVRKTPEEGDYRRFSLYCQGWSQPSGSLRRYTSTRYDGPKTLTDGNWQKEVEGRLANCGAVEQGSAVDQPAWFRTCKRRDGDWPAVIFTTRVNGWAYTGEAIAANVPALEEAIAILEGKRQAAAGTGGVASQLIRKIETIVGTSATQIGVQDIGAVSDLKNLGLHYDYIRDYGRSEDAYRRALEIVTRRQGKDAAAAGDILSNIGLAMIGMDRLAEAQAIFVQAEPLVAKSSDPRDARRILSYKGELARVQGKFDDAVALARKAYDLARETKQPPGSIGHTLMFQARVLSEMKRFDDGIKLGEDAIREYTKTYGSNHALIASTLSTIGTTYGEKKQYGQAREYLAKAATMRQLLYGDSYVLARTLMLLGEAYAGEGNKAAALDSYRRAVAVAGRDRFSEIPFTRNDLIPILDAAVGPSGDAGLLGEAFVATQMARAGVTAQAIARMAARLAASDPAAGATAREMQDGQEKLGRLRAALAREASGEGEARDPAVEEKLKADLRAAAEATEAAERKLQAQFPKYAELVGTRPLTVTELAVLMKPGEALAQFFVTRRATFVLVVRDGKITGHRADIAERDLEAAVNRLRRSLETPGDVPRKFDLKDAYDLYEKLLAPQAQALAGARFLTVVPSGPLLSVPFGLLLTKPGVDTEELDYRQNAFLARSVPTAVLPAVSALRDLRAAAKRPAAPQPFIGFGDPDFAGGGGDKRGLDQLADYCRQGETVDVGLIRGLPRLPESADEVRKVAAALKATPATAITGTKASEATLRATDLSQYRVVFFATHGLLPRALRCQTEPALVLSPPAKANGSENGLLDASEIATLKLNADWVVLSACNTAAADGAFGGESLSGLARAFFYAGGRSLMVSHWPVFSGPTVQLTTQTFDRFAKQAGAGKAAALQGAQLALIDDPKTSHPIYWAPFVLVGDGG